MTPWGPLAPWPASDKRELILVRHGQTVANRDGIIQGWIDYPLTALGRRQAQDTGRALAGLGPVPIASSPLGRAQKTAACLALAMNSPAVLTLPGMTEVHAGAVTGRTWDEFARVHPAAWARFQAARRTQPDVLAKNCLPGWEPLAFVLYRTWHAIAAVLAAVPGSRVLVVSHGDTINGLLTQLLDRDALAGDWRYPQPNCAVSRIRLTASGGHLLGPVQVLHDQTIT